MAWLMLFIEGILAFVSPCILPLIPIYLIYLMGEESPGPKARLGHALAFTAGFTLIYVALGATASGIGLWLSQHQHLLFALAAGVMILLGLAYLGCFRQVSLLWQRLFAALKFKPKGRLGERLQAQLQPTTSAAPKAWRAYLRSFAFGLAFTLTWSPCVGIWLASALALAAQRQSLWQGASMLLVFSLGLGLPFILCALLYEQMQKSLRFLRQHLGLIQKISGLLLILLGCWMLASNFGLLPFWTATH